MNTTAFTIDHPAWAAGPDEHPARVVLHRGEPWLITCDGVGLHRHPLTDTTVEAPPIGHAFATDLPEHAEATPLVAELATLGTVARVPNPWLWDAITTAILRQVVRAEQARKVYRRWCATHGRTLETPAGALSLPPDPATVLGLPDEAFAATGTRFHRTALRAAASAYTLRHEEWEQLPADDLVKALEEVERIGPWTASAAVADPLNRNSETRALSVTRPERAHRCGDTANCFFTRHGVNCTLERCGRGHVEP
jgi:DNA-3-methyladenine glycosylase II